MKTIHTIKNFAKRILVATIMLSALGVGNVWADTEVTFTKDDFDGTNTATIDGITITFADEPTINNQQFRFNCTMTVSSTVGNIELVDVYTNSSESYISPLGATVSTGTWQKYSATNYYWTGSATSVTFTPSSGCRITSIEVSAAEASCTGNPTVGNSLSSVSATTNSITATVPISAIGGCNITENGLVYSTTNNTPTVGGTNCTKVTVTACGSTAANKTVTISDLACGTQYYVRGYATNDAGTSYTNVTTQSTSACPLYTINYNPGSGTCGTSSWTQGSAGASTTLPTATPTATCTGWTFAGWCTTSAGNADENTTSPGDILTGTYTPTGNVTLYAVYTKSADGGGGSFNPSSAVDGDFYITNSDQSYYLKHGVYSTSYFYATAAASKSEANNLFHVTKNNSEKFIISYDNSGTTTYVRVYTSSNNHYCGTTTDSNSATQFTITATSREGAIGTYEVTYNGTRGLVYHTGDPNRFGNYAVSNAATSGYSLLEFEPAGTLYYMTGLTCASCTAAPSSISSAGTNSITCDGVTLTCAGIGSLGSAGCVITSHGFVVGTDANPTLGNSLTTGKTYQAGTSIAASTAFQNVVISGDLAAGTTYHVRSYATNGYDTGYGSDITFTTHSTISPTLTYAANTVKVGSTVAVSSVSGNPGSGSVTYSITSGGSYATIDPSTGTVTGTAAGSVTVKATIAAASTYCAGEATATITVQNKTYTNYRTSCAETKCATPTFSPVSGSVLTPDNHTVTISCATDGATIYYTTDETTPNSSSTEYTGPLSFDAGVTIKAIAIKDGLEDSDVATATYTYGRQFELATSSTTLVEGDEIVIMDGNSAYAMAAQNTIYRDRTDVGISVVGTTLTVGTSSPAQIIELEESGTANQWLFKVNEYQYLYSGTSNHLKTQDLRKEGEEITGNSKWTYSIDASDNATITSQGANTISNIIRYNKTSGQERFSCYGAGAQQPIKIYYYHNSNPYVRYYPDEFKTFQYAVGYGPSLAQALEIKGYNLNGNLTVTCPSGYELSTDAHTFAASNLTLTAVNNKVHTTIYIRLAAGKSTGDYNATLAISGGGITTTNVSLIGLVTPDDASGEMYRAVLDASDIFPYDEMVLLNDTGTWIMNNTNANGNNRRGSNSGFTYKGTTVYVTDAYASVQKIITEESEIDNRWLLKAGNYYLYAGSASANRLQSATNASTATTDHKGEWQVETDATGIATIHAPESSMRDTINFNYNAGDVNRLFSCYNRHMKGGSVVLYYRTLPNIWCKPSSLTGFTVATAASGASAAQSFTIQAKNIVSGNVTLTAPAGYEISLSENTDYTTTLNLTPVNGRVSITTIYVHLLANSGQGTHNAQISATATDATTRYVNLEGEVTPLTVTYHSASEADHVVNLSYGEDAPAYAATNCDDGKEFVGWHTAEVAALQQSDPTTNPTGAFTNVTENKVLYAVFASPNGDTISTIADEDWHMHAWDNTNKVVSGAFSAWKTDGFEPSSYKFTASGVEYNAIVYDLSSAHTITSEVAYSNLKEVRITASSRNSAAIDITVKVSTDKSAWTTIDTKSLPSASSSTPATLTYTLPSIGNYYVRIETGAYDSKNLGITDIHLFRGHADYRTDYSTTCTKAATATVTWVKNGGTSVDPAAPAVGDWLTLPVATKDNYRFEGWTATINGSDKPDVYSAGDLFLVNHDVTLTAHWTELFQVSNPTSGVTSTKDQTVRSATFTMKVIGNRTITPVVDAMSDAQFAVTVGNGTNSGTVDKQFEYTFAFTPSDYSTTQGITDNATFRFKDEASGTLSAPVTISGRSLPQNFVIAAKWGDNWYALPANCTESTSSTAGILIDVDDSNDPTSASAPNYTKYALRSVASTRYVANGSNITFVEKLTTEPEKEYTLYNGSTTSIQVNAQWSNYTTANPERYEWIPTTSDYKDYTLTSADTGNERPVCLNTSGVFGTYTSAQSYGGKVRLLPTTFYEEASVQILEWKANSVVVMYTGSETAATTKVGTNTAGSSQTLASQKLTHGIYELTTSQALTSNTGSPLTLSFGSSTKKSFDIPLIINSAVNASDGHSNHDVVIVNGGKLTAVSTKYSFRNVYVYGGGKLKIASGTSLGVNNIIMRAGGITTNGSGGSATYAYVYPQVELGGTLTSTLTNIKYEYITDNDHWYQLCLPFDGTYSTITYPQEYYGDNVTAANTGSWVIKRYAGEIRATGNYDAWVDIEPEWQEGEPKTVKAGHGYLYWGAPKKVSVGGAAKQRQMWGIQRITMSITAAAATTAETADKNISVDSYSEQATSTKPNDQGWNLVGNPYMVNLTDLSSESIIAGELVKDIVDGKWTGKWKNNGDGVRYVTIPDYHFDNYVAKTASVAAGAGDFMPGRAFFVQIAKGATTLTFAATNRAQLMPALLAQHEENVDIETGIVMSNETLKDEVNFWIKTSKTAEYEYNADYPKTPNATNFNIYGVHSEGDLSWVAISPEIAAGSMAIGYQVPAAGEFMLSLSETYTSPDIDALYVTDHGVSPEVTTNLVEDDYLFTVNQAETNNERFTVSIILKKDEPIDPTALINAEGVDSDKPIKFIYQDKMYILYHGVIYDATGKKVNEINK